MDYFLGPSLKDEVMKIMPVQKQTRAGQRTRFKVCTRWRKERRGKPCMDRLVVCFPRPPTLQIGMMVLVLWASKCKVSGPNHLRSIFEVAEPVSSVPMHPHAVALTMLCNRIFAPHEMFLLVEARSC